MYGPTLAKTLVTAIRKTLQSKKYLEAGHDPARDFQELLKPVQSRKMTMQEAKLVLGVTRTSAHEVNAQYEKLFKMNDPTKGGSFYLQCKLMGAKETIIDSNKQ